MLFFRFKSKNFHVLIINLHSQSIYKTFSFFSITHYDTSDSINEKANESMV